MGSGPDEMRKTDRGQVEPLRRMGSMRGRKPEKRPRRRRPFREKLENDF
jgi:hypothetical protein